MTTSAPAAHPTPSPADECWCCGTVGDVDGMVYLGNHPEVALCLGCARWAGKQAAGIEDARRSGVGVRVRNGLRRARNVVIERGWHRSRVVGGPLRRLGRWLP